MVININLGIGWASSGVEYAQVYRARALRGIGADAKFVFTGMISRDNIEILTNNIGLLDSEVIWLYTFFTDTKIAPVSYTLEDLRKSFAQKNYSFSREGKIAKFVFEGKGNFYTCYMQDEESDLVHRVEMVENGCLIRKDFFTYCRIYSEYYAPLNNSAHLYQRRFFNEDGTIAYEELIDEDKNEMYIFPDQIIYSKEELVGFMISKMNLTRKDVIIIDRTTGIGQAILENAKAARVGIVIHADHFSEGSTDDDYILWNNYYEYSFAQWKHIDFYITATDAQNELVREQFKKYMGTEPNVVTIPVGSLRELKRPEGERRRHSLITASRLASEKHVDWLVEAVAIVHEVYPDVTLDIYGEGPERKTINAAIERGHCETYVKLHGQQKLDEIYKNYEVYFAGSTSEGFGLTLLEAVGSGLPIIGFDVRYGNQNFIEDGRNGYKVPLNDKMDQHEKVNALAEAVIQLFDDDNPLIHENSYKMAEKYLTSEVLKKWKQLIY